MRKTLPVILMVILAAVLALMLGNTKKANEDAQASPSQAAVATSPEVKGAQAIPYDGVEGKNALDILREKHQVTAENSSYGAFVKAIDGIYGDSSHFWAFYVNNQLSPIGADSYNTKNSDKIEWKFEEIKK